MVSLKGREGMVSRNYSYCRYCFVAYLVLLLITAQGISIDASPDDDLVAASDAASTYDKEIAPPKRTQSQNGGGASRLAFRSLATFAVQKSIVSCTANNTNSNTTSSIINPTKEKIKKDIIISRSTGVEIRQKNQEETPVSSHSPFGFLSMVQSIASLGGKVGSRSTGDLPLVVSEIRSFAPPREDTQVEMLICGEAIMSSMLHVIQGAEKEIMISMWEFAPLLPGIRSSNSSGPSSFANPNGTLPSILKEKAEKGVKIYIFLWDTVPILPTAPLVDHARTFLMGLHPNIIVTAHSPDRVTSHHQKFVVADRTVAVVGGLDWTFKRWDTPLHPLFDADSVIRPGCDLFKMGYTDSAKENVRQYFEDKGNDVIENRAEVAARPWRDISLWISGDAATDVALNFLQRWNSVRDDTTKDELPHISSTFVHPIYSPDAMNAINPATRNMLTIGGIPSSNHEAKRRCKVQIVRSLGPISGGIAEVEISHYEAWINAIHAAEKFIYIEQQYIVGKMGEENTRNRVVEAILLRAKHAIDAGSPFRIYIVISTMVEVEPIAYYTRRTLIQDGKSTNGGSPTLSLMSQIRQALKLAKPGSYWSGREPEFMLSVCSLYSVGQSKSGRWDVSDVLVHSKVLVVDDNIAVIGSANINDRSFVGDADSELGVILWDDGKGTIRDFRLRIWTQILGLPSNGITTDNPIFDPSAADGFEMWSDVANANLDLLSSVTNFTPCDSIRSTSTFKKLNSDYQKLSPDEKALQLRKPERLRNIQGQLITFPTRFLEDKDEKSAHLQIAQTFGLTKHLL